MRIRKITSATARIPITISFKSVVDPKKLQFTIDSIAEACKLPAEPDPASVYTEKFLPPLADRKL